MRIALISDIHGNAIALEAVLQDAQRAGVDAIVCLGDIVLGGPGPREALERIMALECPVVRGNTDETVANARPKATPLKGSKTAQQSATQPVAQDAQSRSRDVAQWCRAQLEEHHVEFLQSLPLTATVELTGGQRLLAYHGTPRSVTEPLYPTTPDDELKELFAGVDALVYAGGHTHCQMVRRYKASLVVNPGAVGLPFGFNPPNVAEYAIVHAENRFLDVSLRRVPIDHEAVAAAILASTMPHREWLAAQWHKA